MSTHILCFEQKHEKISVFYLKNFSFWTWNFLYLNRSVFVMHFIWSYVWHWSQGHWGRERVHNGAQCWASTYHQCTFEPTPAWHYPFNPWISDVESSNFEFWRIQCCKIHVGGCHSKIKNRKPNRVDPAEKACYKLSHYGLSHLDLHCLQRYMFLSEGLKGLTWKHSY